MIFLAWSIGPELDPCGAITYVQDALRMNAAPELAAFIRLSSMETVGA